MKKPINLNRLRAFVAIAQSRSFREAARTLGVSQPTLSLQLAQLEEAYGVRLVDRPARHMKLTPLGDDLLAVVTPLIGVEQEALALLEGATGLEHGHLRIGADAPQHVLEGMAAFAVRHPRMDLSLLTGNSQQVLDHVLKHRADVGVVADVDKSAALHRRVLHRDRVVLVVPKGHPWVGRRSVSIDRLATERLIEREPGSRTRALVRRALEGAGVLPRSSIVLSSREAVLEATALGLGIGFVFEGELDDRRLRGIPLRGADMKATEYLICRRGRRAEVAIEAFFDVLG